MKINRMTIEQAQEALRAAIKHQGVSKYTIELARRIRELIGQKKTGCIEPRSVVSVEPGAVFFSKQGIRSIKEGGKIPMG